MLRRVSALQSYRLRLERKKWLVRAFRKRRELTPVVLRVEQIRPGQVLAFATIRNGMQLLPYFLDYYRRMGVDHFLIVENDSADGTRGYLAAQPDVSVWTTDASYKRSRFGMDWVNWLLRKYGTGHWCLTVDSDEFLVYPFCDTRPLSALTDWLEECGIKSFGAMLLDMYPRESPETGCYLPGSDPLESQSWFDAGNYTIKKDYRYQNLWIQGGPRMRVFFSNNPRKAPALNKVPLVFWQRNYAYVSSTHMLLPRGLNRVYEEWGGEKACGALLHTKFLPGFGSRAAEEMSRRQHFAGSVEYKAYYEGPSKHQTGLWCSNSERYVNWRQLESLGILSKGNWA